MDSAFQVHETLVLTTEPLVTPVIVLTLEVLFAAWVPKGLKQI